MSLGLRFSLLSQSGGECVGVRVRDDFDVFVCCLKNDLYNRIIVLDTSYSQLAGSFLPHCSQEMTVSSRFGRSRSVPQSGQKMREPRIHRERHHLLSSGDEFTNFMN